MAGFFMGLEGDRLFNERVVYGFGKSGHHNPRFSLGKEGFPPEGNSLEAIESDAIEIGPG
jgi:hypothetical protein